MQEEVLQCWRAVKRTAIDAAANIVATEVHVHNLLSRCSKGGRQLAAQPVLAEVNQGQVLSTRKVWHRAYQAVVAEVEVDKGLGQGRCKQREGQTETCVQTRHVQSQDASKYC